MKNKLNVYMYLLKLSLKYVKESLAEYNDTKHKNTNCFNFHELYYKTDYHMFAFTQLLYTIKERLENEASDNPEKLKKIYSFFKNKKSNIYLVEKYLTHQLKHVKPNGVNFSQATQMKITMYKEKNLLKVTELSTDRTISSVNSPELPLTNKIGKRKISPLLEATYTELVVFLKQENYNF